MASRTTGFRILVFLTVSCIPRFHAYHVHTEVPTARVNCQTSRTDVSYNALRSGKRSVHLPQKRKREVVRRSLWFLVGLSVINFIGEKENSSCAGWKKETILSTLNKPFMAGIELDIICRKQLINLQINGTLFFYPSFSLLCSFNDQEDSSSLRCV